jgi:plastocyanin
MFQIPRRTFIAAGLASALLLGPACSGSGEGSEPSTAAPAVLTATPASATAPPGRAADLSPSATATPAIEPQTVAPTPAPATSTSGSAGATTAAPTAAPTATPAPRASAISFTLRAFNVQFDRSTIHVPAGATVTATLQNDDPDTDHNLTFGLPGLPHGETCKGPCARTQTFTAPASGGSFFFLCTVHDMFGTFVVDP